jgi:hypothetical protein
MVYRNGFDDMDWATFRANGDARRVPQLLVALRQAGPVERDEAWRELVDLVYHQGDIYDSTVATISALLEDAAQFPELRVEVLDFVAGPAEYIDGPGEHGKQLRRAICDGHSLYVEALGSEDVAEREVGAFILGNILQRGADSVPHLERMIATESEEVPFALAVWALGNLQSSPKVELFHRLSQQAKLALPCAVASAFLARWQGPNVSERETRAVADAVFHGLAECTRLPFHFLEDSLQSPLGGDLLQQIYTGRYTPQVSA